VNSGRDVAMRDEDALALTSVLAPPLVALRSWNELLSKIPFDEINQNTQRLAPLIYCNLRTLGAFPERARLRGAYKYTWSKTVRLIHSLQPLLSELDAQNIDYRIIKGLAIQLILGGVGTRIMGDVDLLVNEASIQQTLEVVVRHGFRQDERVTCSGHTVSDHYLDLNFSRGETHLDIHVAEHNHPTKLLMQIMDESPVKGLFGEFEMKIPSRELLLLHAVVHGDLASGPTDFVQALVDTSRLIPLSDIGRVERLARISYVAARFRRFQRKVAALALPHLGIFPTIRWSWMNRLAASGQLIRSMPRKSAKLTKHIISRRVGRQKISDPTVQNWTQRVSYFLWLHSGQLQVIEKLLCKLLGGLIRVPESEISSGLTLQPFASGNSSLEVNSLSIANKTIDWRIRVAIPDRVSKIIINLTAGCLENLDFWAFSNGYTVSRILGSDRSTHILTIYKPPRSLEVSLRPIWFACSRCYAGLDQMTLNFNLEFADS
jgi:hypothetical protein